MEDNGKSAFAASPKVTRTPPQDKNPAMPPEKKLKVKKVIPISNVKTRSALLAPVSTNTAVIAEKVNVESTASLQIISEPDQNLAEIVGAVVESDDVVAESDDVVAESEELTTTDGAHGLSLNLPALGVESTKISGSRSRASSRSFKSIPKSIHSTASKREAAQALYKQQLQQIELLEQVKQLEISRNMELKKLELEAHFASKAVSLHSQMEQVEKQKQFLEDYESTTSDEDSDSTDGDDPNDITQKQAVSNWVEIQRNVQFNIQDDNTKVNQGASTSKSLFPVNNLPNPEPRAPKDQQFLQINQPVNSHRSFYPGLAPIETQSQNQSSDINERAVKSNTNRNSHADLRMVKSQSYNRNAIDYQPQKLSSNERQRVANQEVQYIPQRLGTGLIISANNDSNQGQIIPERQSNQMNFNNRCLGPSISEILEGRQQWRRPVDASNQQASNSANNHSVNRQRPSEPSSDLPQPNASELFFNRDAREEDPSLAWMRPGTTDAQFLDSTCVGNSANCLNLSNNQIQARRVIKLELPTFSGDAADWPQFIGAYVNSTRQCGYTDEENISRLYQCLKGPAYDAVKSSLRRPGALPTVLKTLKALFGRPDLILESEIEEARRVAPVKDGHLQTLIMLAIKVGSLCDTIHTIGTLEYFYNPILLNELVAKLTDMLKLDWSRFKSESTDRIATLETFNRWLALISNRASDVTRNPSSAIQVSPQPGRGKTSKSSTYHGVHEKSSESDESKSNQGTSNDNYCQCCRSKKHLILDCKKFQGLNLEAKWKVVRSKRLCVSCLGRHWSRYCENRKLCGIDNCEYPHHNILHCYKSSENAKKKDAEPLNATAKTDTTEPKNESSLLTTQSINNHNVSNNQVYFQIIPVTLHGEDNKRVETHAFLDSGSGITLLEEAIAKELGLQGVVANMTLRWTGDIKREELSSKVTLSISGSKDDNKYVLKNVQTTRKLCLPVQKISEDTLSTFKHLRSLPIETYERVQPRILIGVDNFKLLIAKETVEGVDDEPVAIRTRIGWCLFGGSSKSKSLFQGTHVPTDDDIHSLVKGFFGLESIGIRVPTSEVISETEARAVKILEKTVQQSDDGRYTAGLLWKSDDVKLPNSLNMATHRMICFEKKLKRNPDLQLTVSKQIEDYIKKGYLQKLTNEEAKVHSWRTWYLPIFAVTNINKGKTRLVWDAAATVNGISLNTHLLTGPDLLESLLGVLFKFREHRFAVCGDIRQMFHQVKIHQDDQESQRCLWRDDHRQDPTTYRMTVMTFGATCSPSTAQYVKNTHARKYQSTHPRAVEGIIKRHYVDDYIDSFSTESECIEVTKDIIKIHASGGFELRNFLSNSINVIEALTQEPIQTEKLLVDEDNGSKVLGMLWNTTSDTLKFMVNVKRVDPSVLSGEKIPTKRIVLRYLMMVFDPLGLLGFFIVLGKLILKDIWRSGVGWDEPIQSNEIRKWSSWIRALPIIETVNLPRCYFYSSTADRYELHTFVDASEEAAAAVVYLVQFCNNHQTVAFITSKTKIAPMKIISIPRLELQAAVMGARLASAVEQHHTIKIDKRVFWTDSQNVLCWIRSPRRFKQFVAYRIGEILETTNTHEWRWVPTSLNIADSATKWKSSEIFRIPERWFVGPKFLWTPSHEWPTQNIITSEPNIDELEIRCHTTQHEISHNRNNLLPDMERFSKYKRLINTIAYVLRFFHRKKVHESITVDEIEEARLYAIRGVQQQVYYTELRQLELKMPLPSSSALRKLSPFIDPSLVLRINSRIRDVEYLCYDERYPIILPPKHRFTQLLVASVHEQYYHHNHSTVMNELQRLYKIPQLRRLLKTVRARCMRCRIDCAKPLYPEMSPLPRARVAAYLRPFTFTGVDYFGPFVVKHGRKQEKKWGAIFTCLTTRAIHIELASSLSTDAFIMLLRCFICRRGQPKEMFSDNGTNFRGADAELRRILQDNIRKRVQDDFADIKWNFNPPATPHMGGAWERLIRSIKIGLRHALPDRTPSEDLLRSCLIEIESIINSRPLTYVETTDDNLEALTPNHFLLGSSSGVKHISIFSDDVMCLRAEWRKQQRVTQVFWQRWVAEYLPTISQRTQWHDKIEPLKVGDVVAIVSPETPYQWKLGRIESVMISKDGNVRQAQVRTSTGILTRPASKLAILVKETVELSSSTGLSTGGIVADGN